MNKTEIIETKSGKIQGYIEDGIAIFKGIPYAEPPIGELRFQAPIAKKKWGGVLDCTKYGACAWQGYTQLEDWLGKYKPENEDCLFLNIWTPAIDNKKRPVMFWIHGGAFITGTGNEPMYAGKDLSKRGDLVIVTINYRLGFLGFPYIKGKTSNVGSLDQILALKWVHENVSKFGGNPEMITIFGQSAGGYSVVSLCAMPSAKGLFRRVIAHSAPLIQTEVSEKSTKKIMRKLGIKGNAIEEAREISPEKIIEEQNKLFKSDPTNIMAFRPLIDGEIFKKHPLKAFQEGECKDIDFMIGTTLDEAKMFTAMDALISLVAQGEKALMGVLGMMGFTSEESSEVIQKYKEAREGKLSNDPKELIDAIMTDSMFRVPTIRLLEAQKPNQPNTYNYLFTWATPAMDGILGSCHALEIPFAFGTLDAPTMRTFIDLNPVTKDISDKMVNAWIAFARTGNPNHVGIPEWPAYDAENRATMVFGKETKVEYAFREKERLAWEGLLEI